MSYCSEKDVRDGWSKIDDKIEDSDIVRFIDEAEAVIDSFICKRYDVPFAEDSVPRLIRKIAKSLAVFFCKRDVDPRLVVDEYGHVEVNYKIQLAMLKNLGDGTQSLPGVSELEAFEVVENEDEDLTQIHDEEETNPYEEL
jgi:phage gp36-like protein